MGTRGQILWRSHRESTPCSHALPISAISTCIQQSQRVLKVLNCTLKAYLEPCYVFGNIRNRHLTNFTASIRKQERHVRVRSTDRFNTPTHAWSQAQASTFTNSVGRITLSRGCERKSGEPWKQDNRKRAMSKHESGENRIWETSTNESAMTTVWPVNHHTATRQQRDFLYRVLSGHTTHTSTSSYAAVSLTECIARCTGTLNDA